MQNFVHNTKKSAFIGELSDVRLWNTTNQHKSVVNLDN